MAQSMEEIARDMVVAWLCRNDLTFNNTSPEKTGESLGKIYKKVLDAVREGRKNDAGHVGDALPDELPRVS